MFNVVDVHGHGVASKVCSEGMPINHHELEALGKSKDVGFASDVDHLRLGV